ncbi:energy-coupling factor ABC transporter permease [Palleronia caenipelagi]|uniref:Cobalt transporter n=1 Tax=Palleronia caenipelagi TaxID=2489174 RepID=A0A547Q361_9RHOB|nr:energy-coupling factor ABC transporter permease [Palleronia caenipelagi]TRD20811.1 cobalt transporter [Palleronia caenipelagi]
MHIEPGVVNGAKILLSYGTALGAAGLSAKMALENLRGLTALPALAARSVLATAAVFAFFQVLPHYPVGVSEVHFILGSTLFLLFGGGAASVGLALGLLLQGLFFAPLDLPQYGMNVTTLLVPLWAVSLLARKIIAPGTAYTDLGYGQTLALSAAYQGGVVAWVAFWAFYGQGFGAANVVAVSSFGAAYMLVVAIEPLVDLLVLGAAKGWKGAAKSGLVTPRLVRAD